MPVTIRPVQHRDLPVLTDIHHACWHATYRDYMQEFCDLTPPAYFSSVWTAHFDHPHPAHIGLIAEHDAGETAGILRIGTASAAKIEAIRRNGHEISNAHQMGELYQIYLTQQAQGKAIGHTLFQQAVQHLHAQGCHSMVIDVYARNEKAIRFYERQGAAVALHYDDVEVRDNKEFVNPSVLCYMPTLHGYVTAHGLVPG